MSYSHHHISETDETAPTQVDGLLSLAHQQSGSTVGGAGQAALTTMVGKGQLV